VNQRIQLEVCVASIEDAIRSESAGANRLELNMAMELGGLTPTLGLMGEVRRAVRIPVIAMVRPRAAGFRYTAIEHRQMMRDGELLLAAGADGIAVGALREDSSIHQTWMLEYRKLCSDRDLVFHRAFDLIPDYRSALSQLIDCGVDRVLTSGAAETALAGTKRIAELQRIGGEQIGILPASGISAKNAREIIRKTGCHEIHGSFGRSKRDPAGSISAVDYPATCEIKVAEVRSAIDHLMNS